MSIDAESDAGWAPVTVTVAPAVLVDHGDGAEGGGVEVRGSGGAVGEGSEAVAMSTWLFGGASFSL